VRMLTRLSLVLGLLQLISGKGTGCPACDSLQSLWNPDTNKGSCVGNRKDPVKLIINFQQCICGTQGQYDYQTCTECNLDPEGGVPIDGLNFGPLSLFQAQCSIFSNDINTILKPSGLISFVNSIRPDSIVEEIIAEQDILAIEILAAIKITVTTTVTVATASGGLKGPTGINRPGMSIPSPTGRDGVSSVSGSGKISPTSLFGIVALAVSAAIFL
jgi:hypothetical protein